MRAQRTPDRAVKMVTRYNRERAQLEALRERVERKEDALRKTYSAMFNALPEGFAISLSGGEPLYVVTPQGEKFRPEIAYSDQDEALLREFRA